MTQAQPQTTAPEAALRPVSDQKTATGFFDTWSGVNLWERQTFTTELQWGVRYSQSDPLGLRGGTHLFQYAEGNPVHHSDRLGLYTIHNPGHHEFMIDKAFDLIREMIYGDPENPDKPGNAGCRKYLCDSNLNEALEDIKTALTKGGPPYVLLRDDLPRGVCGTIDKDSFQVLVINPRCFRDHESQRTKLPSLLLHEIGHLLRKDTHDNEPEDFFEQCQGNFIDPGYLK